MLPVDRSGSRVAGGDGDRQYSPLQSFSMQTSDCSDCNAAGRGSADDVCTINHKRMDARNRKLKVSGRGVELGRCSAISGGAVDGKRKKHKSAAMLGPSVSLFSEARRGKGQSFCCKLYHGDEIRDYLAIHLGQPARARTKSCPKFKKYSNWSVDLLLFFVFLLSGVRVEHLLMKNSVIHSKYGRARLLYDVPPLVVERPSRCG